jgi:hypothetical protein
MATELEDIIESKNNRINTLEKDIEEMKSFQVR